MKEFFEGTVTPKDWAAVGAIAGVTVLLCAGFFFLFYSPKQEEILKITADNAKVKEDLKAAQDVQKNQEKLTNETLKMKELVSQFEKRLPESKEIPKLVQEFQGFAREINLTYSLDQLQSVTDEKKETIPYHVSVRGNFHQIVSLINRLERYQRYMKVSGLKITEEKDGVAEATFTLSTYRFALNEEALAQKREAAKAKDAKKGGKAATTAKTGKTAETEKTEKTDASGTGK